MRTLALINAKGGVGKTTSTLVMADILHREHGKRVLVIDLDPQLNTSKQMGVYEAGGLCVAHLLVDKTVDVRQVIKASPVYDGVDVIPCDKALEAANLKVLLDTSTMQQLRLRRALKPVMQEYDFCILDCSTAVRNISTINGLAITDDVLVPVTADEYSLGGVMDVASLVVDIQDYNDNIELRGVFLTKSEKNKACKETLRQLEEALGSLVFDTTIRKSATVSAATFEGKALLDYARTNAVVDDYRTLVHEYLERMEG